MIQFALGLIVADTLTYVMGRPPSTSSYTTDFAVLVCGIVLWMLQRRGVL